MTNGKYIALYRSAVEKFLDIIPDDYENKTEIKNLSDDIIDSLRYKAPEIINNVYRQYIFKFTPLLPEPIKNSWGPHAWKHLVDGYKEGCSIYAKS